MKILYITFIDFGKFASGSSVRPQRMYEAFLKCGYDVILLSGSQTRENKEKRKKQINEIKKLIKVEKPAFCYIESPTYPILFEADRRLIKYLYRLNIPIGYFWRDAYYKFDIGTKTKNNPLRNVIKKHYLNIQYARDEKLMEKCAKVVFFPTTKMAQYFRFKKFSALPPAGEDCVAEHSLEEKTCIYVGGISELYGGDLLLKSFDIINREKNNIKLILVCREAELKYLSEEMLKNSSWLEIHHVSGKEALEPLYKRANIALLPRTKNEYNDFCISVKVFEYFSYGLPVVAMYAEEMAKLIKKYDVGEVTDNTAEDFAKCIMTLFDNEQRHKQLCDNVVVALKNENLWKSRVEQIRRELCE